MMSSFVSMMSSPPDGAWLSPAVTLFFGLHILCYVCAGIRPALGLLMHLRYVSRAPQCPVPSESGRCWSSRPVLLSWNSCPPSFLLLPYFCLFCVLGCTYCASGLGLLKFLWVSHTGTPQYHLDFRSCLSSPVLLLLVLRFVMRMLCWVWWWFVGAWPSDTHSYGCRHFGPCVPAIFVSSCVFWTLSNFFNFEMFSMFSLEADKKLFLNWTLLNTSATLSLPAGHIFARIFFLKLATLGSEG